MIPRYLKACRWFAVLRSLARMLRVPAFAFWREDQRQDPIAARGDGAADFQGLLIFRCNLR